MTNPFFLGKRGLWPPAGCGKTATAVQPPRLSLAKQAVAQRWASSCAPTTSRSNLLCWERAGCFWGQGEQSSPSDFLPPLRYVVADPGLAVRVEGVGGEAGGGFFHSLSGPTDRRVLVKTGAAQGGRP
jgi:hypothetical protein